MTGPRHDLVVLDDASDLAADVASRLLALLEEVQTQGRVPQVVLTGGSIADAIHREVARRAPDSSVDWSRVELWWGDERFVPADSSERNARQAREAWLDHVPLDPARVHEVSPSGTTGSLEEAADRYAQALTRAGVEEFDVVMLGLGPDGHVASLFPGHPALEVTGTSTVAVPDSPKPPPPRVSLTFAALNRASAVWFVVSGEDKAEAVASATTGATDARGETLPAARVSGHRQTLWLVDRAAASRCDRRGFTLGTLHHVQLAVPPDGEERCREFWGGLLGLDEVEKPAALAARGGCWFRGPELEVHLGVEQEFSPALKAHPGILVRNLGALAAALEDAGVPVTWDPEFPGHSRFYAADPFGNRLEFLEPERA